MTLSDFTIRVVLAMFFGLLIGLERQLTKHPAGIRTNILVAMGACMFTLFSFLVNNVDMTRIAAQVVTGVGFICTGIIFKEGANIKGLDTAATIWCTAAIGVLTSSGMIGYAAVATAVLIAVNLILRPLINRTDRLTQLQEINDVYRITITCVEEKELAIRELIKQTVADTRLHWKQFDTKEQRDGHVTIEVTLLAVGRRYDDLIEETVGNLGAADGVTAARWEFI